MGAIEIIFGIVLLLEHLFEISLTLFSLIWILIGCSGIAACIIYVLNRRFFNPINRLGEAMQDVADGKISMADAHLEITDVEG